MQDWLVSVFHATQGSADLIRFFGTFCVLSVFFFQSLLFIRLPSLIILGQTRFNSTRLLKFWVAQPYGTWPLIYCIFSVYGAEGITSLAQAIGSVNYLGV